MGMGTQRPDFAEFYRRSKDECLFTVLLSVGDKDTAQDLVAEAFARAWASWRTVSRHPAPTAWVVRTALNANISRWRRRRREVAIPDPAVIADLVVSKDRVTSYLDGKPVESRDLPGLQFRNSPQPVVIGNWVMKDRVFGGKIEEFRILGRELTEADVRKNYGLVTSQPP